MKRSSSLLSIGAACLALLSSCHEMSPSATETVPEAKVILSRKNFKVVSTRISAEDKGFSLLPGIQPFTSLITLIPGVTAEDIPTAITLIRPSEAKALDELYEKSGYNNTGRATQLVNLRKEVGGFNAIIFGRPKLRITADLIEFTAPSQEPEMEEVGPAPVEKKKKAKKR